MTLNLAEVQFENDFFSIDLPDGSTLILNKIDENIATESGMNYVINRINVQITRTDENTEETTYEVCPNVIGMGNEKIRIDSDYAECKGKVLTKDNMMYCTVEYYEQ